MAINRIKILGLAAIGFGRPANSEAIEGEADNLAGLIFIHHRRRTVIVVFVAKASVATLGVHRGDVMKGRDAIDWFGRKEADAVCAEPEARAGGELGLAQRSDLGSRLRILRDENRNNLFKWLEFDNRVHHALFFSLFIGPAAQLLAGHLIELRPILRPVYRTVSIEHIPTTLV